MFIINLLKRGKNDERSTPCKDISSVVWGFIAQDEGGDFICPVNRLRELSKEEIDRIFEIERE